MGLFSNDQPKKQKDQTQEIIRTLTNYQQRTTKLVKQAQETSDYLFSIEQKIERKSTALKEAIHKLNENMHTLEQEMHYLKHLLLNFLNALKSYAKQDEVEKMKEYVEKLSPMQYLTREALEKMIQEKIER